jgi:hypothetical protein
MRFPFLFTIPLLLLFALACGSSGGTSGSGGSGYECPGPCGPVSLAQKQTNPWPIAAAGGRVYWVDHTDAAAFDGVLRSVSTSGGTVSDLAMVTNVRGMGWNSLGADDQFVYWTEGAANGSNQIDSVPLAGGSPHVLYTDTSIQGSVSGVFPAAGSVYTQSSAGLIRIDRQTGAVAVLDARGTCWSQIVISGQDLYCVGGGVTHYTLAGGTPSTVLAASALGSMQSVVAIGLSGSTMYLMAYASGGSTASVYSVPVSGGMPTQLATSLQVKSEWFVVNDAGLFWVAGVPGGMSYPLMRLSPSGGTPTVVNQTGAANFIAADAHGVYLPDYYGDIDEYVF